MGRGEVCQVVRSYQQKQRATLTRFLGFVAKLMIGQLLGLGVGSFPRASVRVPGIEESWRFLTGVKARLVFVEVLEQFGLSHLIQYKDQLGGSEYRRMWYLNYCAPFLNNNDIMKAGRYFMMTDLLILFVIYIIIMIFYQCTTPKIIEIEPPQNSNQPIQQNSQNNLSGRPQKQYLICGLKFLPKGEFRRGFSIIFGHHAVAVASCMLYSPYIAQMVMCGVYILLAVVLFVFVLLKFQKLTIATYVIMMLLNVALLFCAVLGVGASNINETKMECSLDQSP